MTSPRQSGTMSTLRLTRQRRELKKLSARVTALEKLLDRIVRQKPVSEKQLEKVLESWSNS